MIPALLGIMTINFVLVQFVPGGPIEQIIAELEGRGDVFESIAGGGGEEVGGSAEATDFGYVGARGLPPAFNAELDRYPAPTSPKVSERMADIHSGWCWAMPTPRGVTASLPTR